MAGAKDPARFFFFEGATGDIVSILLDSGVSTVARMMEDLKSIPVVVSSRGTHLIWDKISAASASPRRHDVIGYLSRNIHVLSNSGNGEPDIGDICLNILRDGEISDDIADAVGSCFPLVAIVYDPHIDLCLPSDVLPIKFWPELDFSDVGVRGLRVDSDTGLMYERRRAAVKRLEGRTMAVIGYLDGSGELLQSELENLYGAISNVEVLTYSSAPKSKSAAQKYASDSFVVYLLTDHVSHSTRNSLDTAGVEYRYVKNKQQLMIELGQ